VHRAVVDIVVDDDRRLDRLTVGLQISGLRRCLRGMEHELGVQQLVGLGRFEKMVHERGLFEREQMVSEIDRSRDAVVRIAVIAQPHQTGRDTVFAARLGVADRAGAGVGEGALLTPKAHAVARRAIDDRGEFVVGHPQLLDASGRRVALPTFKGRSAREEAERSWRQE
jgi:hypothetical protein